MNTGRNPRESIAAAKAVFAALPAGRRAALRARFDLAAIQAQAHANYVRPS